MSDNLSCAYREEILLERITFATQRRFPEIEGMRLGVDIDCDWAARELVATLRAHIWGQKIQRNWFQRIVRWLIGPYETVYKLCPHIKEPQTKHLQWFAESA